MNFLNPWALIGLAASSIPVIIHLLNLRKLKTIEFSDLRFLKELTKTKIRRLKIRQILLLIIRALLIAFLALAFARPMLKTNAPVFGTHAPTSVVLIIDDSPSMDLSDERGERFKQAQNGALSIISKLSETDEVALLKASNSLSAQTASFSSNFAGLKDEIMKMRPSSAPAVLDNQLRVAAKILPDAKNGNKEVFILSDFQANTFKKEVFDSLKFNFGGSAIYTVQIGEKSKIDYANLSIDSIYVATKIFQKGKPVEIECKVKNHSKRDVFQNVVSLYFNDVKVAQRSLDIPAGETRLFSIAAPFSESGLVFGKLELESDAFEPDNRAYFSFSAPESPKILLVGDKKDAQFIKMALYAGAYADNLQEISASAFATKNLSDFDELIIASPLSASDAERLKAYVYSGGSALIFPNSFSENEALKFINDFGFGFLTYKTFSQDEPAALNEIDYNHPILKGVFKDEKKAIELGSPKIYKALPALGGQSIAKMPGGSFLSEAIYGEGKAVYFAVAPNLEWSSFPLNSLFPPTLYRSVAYIGLKAQYGEKKFAGEQAIISLNKKNPAGNYKLIDPLKTESFVQAVALPSGAKLNIGLLSNVGTYGVFSQNGELAASLDANMQADESLQNLLNEENINKYINSRIDNTSIEKIADADKIADYTARAKQGLELWRYLAIAALILAIVEIFVSRSSKKTAEGIE